VVKALVASMRRSDQNPGSDCEMSGSNQSDERSEKRERVPSRIVSRGDQHMRRLVLFMFNMFNMFDMFNIV